MTFHFLQHMHRHANYLHRAPEMASLPAVPIAATPSCLSRCENGQNKKEKKNKKNKSSSTSDEKQNRRSRSAAKTAVEDQPEMNQQQPKRPSTQQQFISFGMAPTTYNKQPQQLLTQSQQSDGGESMVSGYIYTGMDRDIAEEFILHSMTIPSATQASSVKSGFSVADKRDVCWTFQQSTITLLYNELSNFFYHSLIFRYHSKRKKRSNFCYRKLVLSSHSFVNWNIKQKKKMRKMFGWVSGSRNTFWHRKNRAVTQMEKKKKNSQRRQ